MNFIVRNLNVVGIIDNINCYNYLYSFFLEFEKVLIPSIAFNSN